jgi:hypothetical protein
MTSSIAARSIPGFGGEIFAPGDPAYDEKRVQYASISYPEKQGPGGTFEASPRISLRRVQTTTSMSNKLP